MKKVLIIVLALGWAITHAADSADCTRYTNVKHGIGRMAQRFLSQEQVDNAIQDGTSTEGREETRVYSHTLQLAIAGDQKIVVVVNPEECLVITAFWDTGKTHKLLPDAINNLRHLDAQSVTQLLDFLIRTAGKGGHIFASAAKHTLKDKLIEHKTFIDTNNDILSPDYLARLNKWLQYFEHKSAKELKDYKLGTLDHTLALAFLEEELNFQEKIKESIEEDKARIIAKEDVVYTDEDKKRWKKEKHAAHKLAKEIQKYSDDIIAPISEQGGNEKLIKVVQNNLKSYISILNHNPIPFFTDIINKSFEAIKTRLTPRSTSAGAGASTSSSSTAIIPVKGAYTGSSSTAITTVKKVQKIAPSESGSDGIPRESAGVQSPEELANEEDRLRDLEERETIEREAREAEEWY